MILRTPGITLVWLFGCNLLLSLVASADERVILPVFGNQPDTGAQFGVALFWNETAAPDARGLSLFAVATQKGQARGVVSGRYPGPVAERTDTLTLTLRGAYFPDEFYGYRSAYQDQGYRYVERSWGVDAGWFYPLAENWRVGGEVLYRDERIAFDQPARPEVRQARGTAGDRYAGVRLTLTRNTRDEDSWPTQGTFARSEVEWVTPLQQGVAFQRARQSLTLYLPVLTRGVLATGVQIQAATAQTPFTWMPALSGNSWLRGAGNGQFRHRLTHSEQMEVRWPLSPRFAGAVFLHQGQVARQLADWAEVAWQRGGGLGLRYSVSSERRQNIRADLGWVNGRSGVVISFGEAF